MMTTHATMMETSRHTKRTLYVVAAFYVVVGFVAATASALNGDRLGTFLGFLIISGALGATSLLRAVLRIGVRISAMGDAVTEMHARLGRVEAGLNEARERAGLDGRSPPNAGGVRMLDLATMGNDNPDVLTAATLDQDAYPRLVASMEDDPAATAPSDEVPWPLDGYMEGCREGYPALVDTAGAGAVASLSEELADRVERSLREAFSSRVRGGDYAGGLAIGERICSLLPDRPVTAEFQRIRPYLVGRLRREASTSDQPLAASQ